MSENAQNAADDRGEIVEAIKGFDAKFKCRGYQFAVGETYRHDGKVEICASGFHGIEGYPLEVFGYYPPAGSRFAIVKQWGDLGRHRQDSKLVSASISIDMEISLSDLIGRAVKWVFDRAKPEGEGSSATGDLGAASATGTQGAASATGWQGAASATGEQGAASATGWRGAASATGWRGAASATGWQGAASATGEQGAASATGGQGAASATGEQGAASATGEQGAASATGWQGAASATGEQGAASATGTQGAASATGERGAASATGWQGAASATGTQGAASATGERGAASATGRASVAMSIGFEARARGSLGCAICLVHRDETTGEIVAIRATKIGENGTEPDVYYTLSAAGEFVRMED